MLNNNSCCIKYLILIAGRKHKTALLNALSKSGGKLIEVVYGKGSVKSNYLSDMFGLVHEENKILVTCLLPGDKVKAVFDMLIEKFDFDKPNTGIAFTIAVEALAV